jgi:hypothetical protein
MIAFIKKYLPVPICAALAVFFTYFPITDTDIFWHLAAGREMAATGTFLHADPFSFTNALPQWIDLHWLFQLLVYGLYLMGGLKAIVVFKLAVVAFVCVLLCLIFRNLRYAYASAFCGAMLFYQARYLVLDRPVLITMLCMVLYLFLFEQVRQGKSRHWLWLCVPLQAVWTNSQGLYPIGIFIIGAYAFEYLWATRALKNRTLPSSAGLPLPVRQTPPDARKIFISVFLLSCLSCFATPYGVSGILLPFKLFARITPDARNVYSLNISENVPLLSLTGFEAGYRFVVFLTAGIAAALFVLNRKRIRIAHVLLFCGFLFLAFGAVRNVLLYLLVIVLVIASGVMQSDVLFRIPGRSVWVKRLSTFLVLSAGIGLLWKPVADHWSVVSTYPPHRTLSPFRFPEKITDYLQEHPVPGEMFNDIRYGGYLIWKLYPQKKVFIDGRLVIRSPGFFAEYLAICEQPELFPFVADKFNITQVILPSAIFDRYLKLIKWLFTNSSDWHLEYTDGTSFLFVRNDARRETERKPALLLSDPHTVDSIAASINAQWRDAPAVRREALGYFSDVLGYLGLAGSAKKLRP